MVATTLIIAGDFNIKDNNWNLSYPHHLIHVDTLREIANSFNLELLLPIDQVPTQYINNSQDLNSVLGLMFLYANTEKFNNLSHTIQIYLSHLTTLQIMIT